jgi:hypothetical protein
MRELTIVRVNFLELIQEAEAGVLLQLAVHGFDQSGCWTDLVWIPYECFTCISHPTAANNHIGYVDVERWVIEEAFPSSAEEIIDDSETS